MRGFGFTSPVNWFCIQDLLRYFLLFILAFFPQTSLPITEHSSQNCIVSFGLVRNPTLKCEYLKKQPYTSRLLFCLCWGLVVVWVGVCWWWVLFVWFGFLEGEGFVLVWLLFVWGFFCKPAYLFNLVGIHHLLPFLCSYVHLPFVIPSTLFFFFLILAS